MFWGVEKLFWGIDGVNMTAVGYSAGKQIFLIIKKYAQVYGHNEVVLINFDPDIISLTDLFKIFWDPRSYTRYASR